MTLPTDYSERVYAGVLGKIIGVYLGRPFEGWAHRSIMKHLGPITYYVHEKLGMPLIVTDDDISGTLTFLRAFEDTGCNPDLTPQDIGETWLNYLIEKRTILWWGGMGNSTEHTAYLRLKSGIKAPQSGSAALNGKVVSEQIGAQIFVDGWAMLCPGDPEKAADFARRAGSVSHDGEAIYGAQVVAALEAEAFIENDVNKLIDTALRFIPSDSIIRRLIDELRALNAREPDWMKAREWVEANYGYDKYGGNCHMVPNHGLIILSLLYAEDDFSRALEIVNTAGWDTDCNSANVGAFFGIKNGLAGLETGPDWRGPVADRIEMASADGGRAITDALHESIKIINMGRSLAGQEAISPNDGARFHFSLPGAVQGFEVAGGKAKLENIPLGESRALSLTLETDGVASAETPIFQRPAAERHSHPAYDFMATPLIGPGDEVTARFVASRGNDGPVQARIYMQAFTIDETLAPVNCEALTLAPGEAGEITFTVVSNEARPYSSIGLEVEGKAGDSLCLDQLGWQAKPEVVLTRPAMPEGTKPRDPARAKDGWRRQWINGVDDWQNWYPEPFRLIQNEGRGLLMYGTRDWKDYSVSADVTPHMVMGAGLAARVQGMRRFYGLILRPDGVLQITKCLGGEEVLAETNIGWEFGDRLDLKFEVEGQILRGFVGGKEVLKANDEAFSDGGIALVAEDGRTATQRVEVSASGSGG